jgi:UDPglucose--hexose-1-phosphate uridylyltransferase
LSSEVRVDPLTGLKTIIAAGRAARPGGWPIAAGEAPPIDPEGDPFAPGHEDRTPPELDALCADDDPTRPWRVRVVPNLYPALDDAAPAPERSHAPDLFTASAARGAHEVVVNAPDAVTSLAELEPGQVASAMEMWRTRSRVHHDHGAAYVHVIVNERAEGGASLPHTHAQVYALDFVPAQVARERERFTAHATRTMGGNLLQDLVGEEVRQRVRMVAIDDEAILLSPYAARVPYQLLLAPRRPRARFDDDGPLGAALLHRALNAYKKLLGFQPPLNLWVRTAPAGAEHFCWRIDVLPRLTHLAGLELGVGVGLNIVSPEDAAAQLREHLA